MSPRWISSRRLQLCKQRFSGRFFWSIQPSLISKVAEESRIPGAYLGFLTMRTPEGAADASRAAWVVLPPSTDVNTGNWDGLATAAEKLRGKPNMEVEIKPGGEVEVRGL